MGAPASLWILTVAVFMFLPEELVGEGIGSEAALKLSSPEPDHGLCWGSACIQLFSGHGMCPGELFALLALQSRGIKMSELRSEGHCHTDGNSYKR